MEDGTFCKLCCKRNKKMAKAHIIPKALYGTTISKAAGEAVIAVTDPTVRPVRSRIGEYDQTILCLDCEKETSHLDDLAFNFFYKQIATPLVDKDEVIAFEFEKIDPKKLLKFYDFLLWRIGASDRPMFKNIRLGLYQERLRRSILNLETDLESHIDVLIQRYKDDDHAILGPTKRSFDGVTGYSVMFAGYSSWIKVDQRPMPVNFRKISLKSRDRILAMASSFETSAERRAMVKLVKEHDGLRKLTFGSWGKKSNPKP